MLVQAGITFDLAFALLSEEPLRHLCLVSLSSANKKRASLLWHPQAAFYAVGRCTFRHSCRVGQNYTILWNVQIPAESNLAVVGRHKFFSSPLQHDMDRQPGEARGDRKERRADVVPHARRAGACDRFN